MTMHRGDAGFLEELRQRVYSAVLSDVLDELGYMRQAMTPPQFYRHLGLRTLRAPSPVLLNTSAATTRKAFAPVAPVLISPCATSAG